MGVGALVCVCVGMCMFVCGCGCLYAYLFVWTCVDKCVCVPVCKYLYNACLVRACSCEAHARKQTLAHAYTHTHTLTHKTQEREGEIRVLDFGNNSMTAVGGDALAKLLNSELSLRDLNLYMNDLGDAGIAKVSGFVSCQLSYEQRDLPARAQVTAARSTKDWSCNLAVHLSFSSAPAV